MIMGLLGRVDWAVERCGRVLVVVERRSVQDVSAFGCVCARSYNAQPRFANQQPQLKASAARALFLLVLLNPITHVGLPPGPPDK